MKAVLHVRYIDNDDDNGDYDSRSSVKLNLLRREIFGRLSGVHLGAAVVWEVERIVY